MDDAHVRVFAKGETNIYIYILKFLIWNESQSLEDHNFIILEHSTTYLMLI